MSVATLVMAVWQLYDGFATLGGGTLSTGEPSIFRSDSTIGDGVEDAACMSLDVSKNGVSYLSVITQLICMVSLCAAIRLLWNPLYCCSKNNRIDPGLAPLEEKKGTVASAAPPAVRREHSMSARTAYHNTHICNNTTSSFAPASVSSAAAPVSSSSSSLASCYCSNVQLQSPCHPTLPPAAALAAAASLLALPSSASSAGAAVSQSLNALSPPLHPSHREIAFVSHSLTSCSSCSSSSSAQMPVLDTIVSA